MAISNKPWGSITRADYDDAQWSRACLIHRTGPGTAKENDSLPVYEPNGDLNRNGVFAAAARLAGAGGGVKGATPAEKQGAARRLLSLYREIGAKAPDSIRRMAG
jgi:hypothetical protein